MFQARDLKDRFLSKGYPPHVLTEAHKKALNSDRSLLLCPRPKPNDVKICIIGTYDNQAQRIIGILRKHWKLLRLDTDIAQSIPIRPSITYRRGRSLGDRLSHSHYVNTSTTSTWLDRTTIGTYRCGSCSFCPLVIKTKTFTSSATGNTYSIRYFANCKSHGLVYMYQCPCPLDYVGKTRRELRKRIGEHLGDIRHPRDTPIARHVWDTHNKDSSCLQLEKICPSSRRGQWDNYILKKEPNGFIECSQPIPML